MMYGGGMANILKQLIEGKLDVEVIKKKLCNRKLQVSLRISPCKIIKLCSITLKSYQDMYNSQYK